MWRGKKLHSQQTAATNIQNIGISLPEATTTQVTKDFYQLPNNLFVACKRQKLPPIKIEQQYQ
jgi:hypothetical protein